MSISFDKTTSIILESWDLIDHWNQFTNNSNLSNSSWKWATAALCWGQNYKLNIKILVHPRAQTQFPIYINLRIFIHSHHFCLVLFSVFPSQQSVFCPLCPWSKSDKLGFILLQISRFSEIEGDQMEQKPLCWAHCFAQYWTQISSHYFKRLKNGAIYMMQEIVFFLCFKWLSRIFPFKHSCSCSWLKIGSEWIWMWWPPFIFWSSQAW